VTPKRRRSVAAGDVSPPASGDGGATTTTGCGSAVKSRPGSSGSGGQTPRMTVPLSERQQLALLMQMTADEQPTTAGESVLLVRILHFRSCRGEAVGGHFRRCRSRPFVSKNG